MGLGEGGRKRAATMRYLVGLPSYRNLADVVERVLHQHRKALKHVHLVTKLDPLPSPLLRHRRPDRERNKQRARAVLVERYEAVQRLVKQGLSHRAIARELQMHREAVIRY